MKPGLQADDAVVLVVDDDPHIRDVIGFALEKAGMTTDMARDGGEALLLFRRRPPDMIILDVGMPDTDGPPGAMVTLTPCLL